MAKKQTVSDEAIIAALLTSNSIKAAADALQISPRTIYERMQSKRFMMQYEDQKGELISTAVRRLHEKLEQAIVVLGDILEDPEVAPATRLQAVKLTFDTFVNLDKIRNRNDRNVYELQPKDPFAELDDYLG